MLNQQHRDDAKFRPSCTGINNLINTLLLLKDEGREREMINLKTLSFAEGYNITQLISRFACLSPKESKCSKWQDGNFYK